MKTMFTWTELSLPSVSLRDALAAWHAPGARRDERAAAELRELANLAELTAPSLPPEKRKLCLGAVEVARRFSSS